LYSQSSNHAIFAAPWQQSFLLPPALAGGAMDEPVRFTNYKGKQILLVELSKHSVDNMGELAKLVLSYVTPQPRGSVLLLADFTAAKLDKKAIDIMKPALVMDRPYLKRSAWVGAENIPKTLYEHLKSFSRRDLPTFKTREEAMEWLVKD
jgi:hypothetical protein